MICKDISMKKYFVLLLVIFVPCLAFAQLAPERHDIRKGNKSYKNEDYEKAEVAYRHGLEKDSTSFGARFNLANALYKQDKHEQSEQLFESLKEQDVDVAKKAKLFHNLGNSQLQQEKYEQSIESYKQSLRLNPTDDETRANLAYAQLMLQNDEQQQNQGGNSKDKDDQNENDKKNNQENNQDNNGDNKDDKDEQNQDKQQNQDNQEQKDNQQQQQQKISSQDAQRILEAVQADEKQTQEKVQKEKAKALKRQKIEKNW